MSMRMRLMSDYEMQFIHAGIHSRKELQLYLKLTNITSDSKISALEDYMLKGVRISQAYKMNGVDAKDFREVRKTINKIAGVVDELINLRMAGGSKVP